MTADQSASSEKNDALEIPEFLRRSKIKENTMAGKKPEPQEDPVEAEKAEDSNEKEVRPTKAQFLEAANAIDEIDEEIGALEQSIAAKKADLNERRNSASEVVRKYLGRKR